MQKITVEIIITTCYLERVPFPLQHIFLDDSCDYSCLKNASDCTHHQNENCYSIKTTMDTFNNLIKSCAFKCLFNANCTHYSHHNWTCYLRNAPLLTHRVPTESGDCGYFPNRLNKAEWKNEGGIFFGKRIATMPCLLLTNSWTSLRQVSVDCNVLKPTRAIISATMEPNAISCLRLNRQKQMQEIVEEGGLVVTFLGETGKIQATINGFWFDQTVSFHI